MFGKLILGGVVIGTGTFVALGTKVFQQANDEASLKALQEKAIGEGEQHWNDSGFNNPEKAREELRAKGDLQEQKGREKLNKLCAEGDKGTLGNCQSEEAGVLARQEVQREVAEDNRLKQEKCKQSRGIEQLVEREGLNPACNAEQVQ